MHLFPCIPHLSFPFLPSFDILVGLYADHADSAFRTKPMLRVSRTQTASEEKIAAAVAIKA